MGFRRETADEDRLRSNGLLDALDRASEMRPDPDAELDQFETVILFGVANDPAQPYPPAGHGYPRRK